MAAVTSVVPAAALGVASATVSGMRGIRSRSIVGKSGVVWICSDGDHDTSSSEILYPAKVSSKQFSGCGLCEQQVTLSVTFIESEYRSR